MFLTAFDGVPYSPGWFSMWEGGKRRIRAISGSLLMSIPIAIGKAIEQFWMFELHHGSGFDEVLGYVAFESGGKINWCVDDSV